MAIYRQFADIRFKLLAFVPALSAAAIALLTSADVSGWATTAFGVIGLVITLGIVIYDQRNSQFYNGSVGRAQHLEKMLAFPQFGTDDAPEEPGLFGSRDFHRKLHILGLRVSHGLGLALVYSAVLGAWAFAAALPAGGSGHRWVPAAVALVVGASALVQLLLNDKKLRRLGAWLGVLRLHLRFHAGGDG